MTTTMADDFGPGEFYMKTAEPRPTQSTQTIVENGTQTPRSIAGTTNGVTSPSKRGTGGGDDCLCSGDTDVVAKALDDTDGDRCPTHAGSRQSRPHLPSRSLRPTDVGAGSGQVGVWRHSGAGRHRRTVSLAWHRNSGGNRGIARTLWPYGEYEVRLFHLASVRLSIAQQRDRPGCRATGLTKCGNQISLILGFFHSFFMSVCNPSLRLLSLQTPFLH
ncbi:unnamed protein product [Protopolystoma xenopodis]|uniref:Uncharacterized protein n=1 Tax=Protopolystoma xenopodis TaxID=117903 RepID=A0A3S5BU42_9PLAT|nr:unnamed protein product [Protopolystoma xenopodis]